MNWEEIGVAAAIITFLVTFFSFYLALRAEFRKNAERLATAKLSDEKRHASHERRLALLEERLANIETIIRFRMEEINRRISELFELWDKH